MTKKNKINKNTVVLYRTTARNCSSNVGCCYVEAGRLFNFDGFNKELNRVQADFLNSLNEKSFTEIPEELADYTSWQNFREEIKLLNSHEVAHLNDKTPFQKFMEALELEEDC